MVDKNKATSMEKDIKFEDMICFECLYTNCFMRGHLDRVEKCQFEKLRDKEGNCENIKTSSMS